jgi:hypothetical protein
MNKAACAGFGLVVLVLIGFMAGEVRADWNVGGPHKMHWPQLPDLTVNGIDINCTYPNILADDFRCTQNGPITNIHIWGSWMSDQVDPNVSFTLSIHADIPTNEQQAYSMPGATLWYKYFPSLSFKSRLYTNGIAEGWMNPPSMYIPPFPVPPDTMCYQYNFTIDPLEAFTQVSGTVYWLDVQAFTTGGKLFGWKTCEPILRWNDDSCWTTGEEPMVSGWTNLIYRPPHGLAGQTLDQAFVIDGGLPTVKERETCAKWEQPPDCARGVDVLSFYMAGTGSGGPALADDWLCDGRPITEIVWWGSYIGWRTNVGVHVPPPDPGSGVRPVGFRLTWYTDNPGDPTLFSQPADVLARDFYPLAPFETRVAGAVYETTQCVSRLDFVGSNVFEHEYVYSIRLTNIWNEKDGRIYWLSVQAAYMTPPTNYFWGWKTTSPEWNWHDDAVRALSGQPWTNLFYPPPNWGWVTNHPYAGTPLGLAFQLRTDICPRRCKKWAQPPDMEQGQDMQSWRTDLIPGVLRADDFISDGRPIDDLHWWGSYLNWMAQDPGSETNPIAPPTGVDRPLGFNLSWHLNDEAAGCLPGAQLTNIFVSVTNCHETYYGSVFQSWLVPPGYEHEYQYYVDLLDQAVNCPWLETNGVHYWLNIQAVFATNFMPGSTHTGWGWKITPARDNHECFSAVSRDNGANWTHDKVEVDGGLMHPRHEQEFDLAFELTTTNVPWNTNWFVDVVFTNIALSRTWDRFAMWSTGYCGCGRQILQMSPDLLLGEPAWWDVSTNSLPRPDNLWLDAPLSTQRIFRIKTVN